MFVYRTQIYHLFLPCRPAPLPLCCLYTDIHTAPTIYRHVLPSPPCPCHAAVYRCQSEYTARSPPAPPHMPLKRSYFNFDGLLLLGYKYKGSTNKTRYSLNMAVSRLCCAWAGWGIYDILRGAGYSLHHTPHIKGGNSRRLPFSRFAGPASYSQVTMAACGRLSCVRPFSWRVSLDERGKLC